LDQAEALISHWLCEEPADDSDQFIAQLKKAYWLETRHYEALAKLMGAKK
jgi:hypothetical protein